MSRWLMPAFALAAFVVALCVLPATGWVMREFVGELAGAWSTKGSGSDSMSPLFASPTHQTPDAAEAGQSDDATFLYLASPQPEESNISSRDPLWASRMNRLYAYCAKKDSAVYYAQFARLAYAGTAVVARAPRRREDPATGAIRRLMVEACVAGEREDPDNAFFPLVRSGQLYMLGADGAARSAFIDASRLAGYDDYAHFEPDVRSQWMRAEAGYQGVQMQLWAEAGTNYAHFSGIRAIAAILARPQDLVARAASVRLGNLLMDRASTGIGIMIGRLMVVIGLDPTANPTKVLAETRLRDGCSALHLELDSGTCHDVVAKYEAFTPPLIYRNEGGDIFLLEGLRPVFGGGVIAAVALAPLLFAFAWLRTKSPRLSAFAPYATWLALVPLLSLNRDEFIAQGALVVVAGAAAVFFAARFVSRRSKDEKVGWTILAALVGSLLGGWTWAFVAANVGVAAGAWDGTLVTVAMMPLVRGLGSRWQFAAGVAAVPLFLLLGIAVKQELDADRALAVVSGMWRHQADAIRANRAKGSPRIPT